MTTIVFPSSQWLNTLKVGDSVSVYSTAKVGGDINIKHARIKTITATGLIKLEGIPYSFKDGYRRGHQYSGNCWLQPTY